MDIKPDILAAIGNTPLIKLRRASELTGCTILGKAEFMNPGHSVKDRAALFIVEDAVRRGLLRPGGIIVEGTAGNTGIGLALVANVLGFRTLIVIPETQSQEKKDMLRLAGAELIEVPAVPYANPNNYVKISGPPGGSPGANGAEWRHLGQPVRQCRQPGRSRGNDRPGNLGADGRDGPWLRQRGRNRRNASGRGIALKEKNPQVQIALADPMGAALYHYFTHGELKSTGSSITEGIGQGRITRNLEGAPIDLAFQIPDEEALPIIFDLVEHEGLCLGGSSGINIAGAIRLAKHLGPGHTIVTILCDSGSRYQSKLFNPDFLSARGLPLPGWLTRGSAVDPGFV